MGYGTLYPRYISTVIHILLSDYYCIILFSSTLSPLIPLTPSSLYFSSWYGVFPWYLLLLQPPCPDLAMDDGEGAGDSGGPQWL